MQNLTPDGQALVDNVAQRYGLSREAVQHMLAAVNQGGGSMAQFNSPELGGSGQWMRGGMTMVGDMFNYGLQGKVDSLCNELSNALANMQIYPVIPPGTPGSNQWWPVECGVPFSSGAQNNIRYAIFPNRLAVELNGQVTVYDTLDHQIGGVSQQQGGDTSLTFSSQYGTVSVSSLPVVSGPGVPAAPQQNFAQPTRPPAPQLQQPQPAQNPSMGESFAQPDSTANDILGLIERLAQLRDMGALSDEEFNAKKLDLLNRL
jgi:hypothetical protein